MKNCSSGSLALLAPGLVGGDYDISSGSSKTFWNVPLLIVWYGVLKCAPALKFSGMCLDVEVFISDISVNAMLKNVSLIQW